MTELLDGAFWSLGQILFYPLLFVLIYAAFLLMSGQKPERAFSEACGILMRIVFGLLKLVVRFIVDCIRCVINSSRSNRRRAS